MNGAYRTIAGRIRSELQELARVVERTGRIWQQATTSTDDYYVDATALNLHGVYAGLERLFEIIADGVDQGPVRDLRHPSIDRERGSDLGQDFPEVADVTPGNADVSQCPATDELGDLV